MLLQDLIEKVIVLRQSVERMHGGAATASQLQHMSAKMAEYAELLAAQGSLTAAIRYLGTTDDVSNPLISKLLLFPISNHLYSSLSVPSLSGGVLCNLCMHQIRSLQNSQPPKTCVAS